MKGAYAAVGVLVLAASAGGYWWYTHRKQEEAQAAVAPPPAPAETQVGPQEVPAAPVQLGKPPEPEPSPLPKSAAGALATVAVGIQVQNAIGAVAEKVGGEGAGNAARVAQVSIGGGLIVGKATERIAEKLGAPKVVSTSVGIGTGVAVVAGAPVALAAVGANLAGKGLQAVGRLVIGKEAVKKVSNVVAQFDPLKRGSVASVPIKAASTAVKAAGKVLGGLKKLGHLF